MTPFIPGSASTSLSSEVELSIACKNLIGSDVLSKSDPICVTYIQYFGTSQWVEYHRTEIIRDNHDPVFASKIIMQYRFEEQQPLKFEIYDIDADSSNLKDHDFLGFAICNLGQIISNGKVQLQLQNTNSGARVQTTHSYIIVNAEELVSNNDEAVVQLNGTGLDKKDWFGKSDPFIEIHKVTEANDYLLVHKTEVIKNTLNPRWKRFSIPVKTLCNADYHRSLKFICYDWNSNGKHSLIGEFQTTFNEICENTQTFQLIHPDKKKKTAYKNSGKIHVEFFEIVKIYSFMDFIMGGLQIHCTVAIDFTASNGDPLHPQSLHYVSSEGYQNQYEQAMQPVVSIIEDYDSDKQFPVLGFGARIPPDGHISHEFFVNFDPTSPFCAGVNGVLQAYRSCIRQIQLSGPTNFSPIIQHVIKFANSFDDGNNYFILLILTDGIISDMEKTIKAIVEASRLAISIIIVGVGSADFSAMEVLDADTQPLVADGDRAQRDIVQFVPFNKYHSQGDPRTARLRLAKEVLAEVPKQLLSYMRSRNFTPKPPNKNVVNLPPNPDHL